MKWTAGEERKEKPKWEGMREEAKASPGRKSEQGAKNASREKIHRDRERMERPKVRNKPKRRREIRTARQNKEK